MKALVTGGGGFLGSAIVRQLSEQGYDVCTVGRNYYEHLPVAVKQHQGSICDVEFLKKVFIGQDVIFHVAAKAGVWGSWEDYHETNVMGTLNVIQAALESKVLNLVYTSSPSVVFDRHDIENGDESLSYPKDFLCHYAETKALAEKEVLRANSGTLRTTSLRPHLIWGPDDTNLIPRLIERGRKGLIKQVGDGTNMVDIIYIDNAAKAHVLAAENLYARGDCAGKAYFISQDEPVNLWDWINELFSMVDINPIKKKISYRKAYCIGAVLEWVYKRLMIKKEPLMTRFVAEQLSHTHWFNTSAAKQDFGFIPEVSTKEGLNRLARWINSRK